MGRNVKSNGGFSIIEVMISLVLVSFALMAIVAVFPRMTTHRKVVREMDQARILAVETLDRVQLASQLHAAAVPPNPAPFEPAELINNVTVPGSNTRFRINVNAAEQVPGAVFIRRTTVTVSWNKGGRTHNVSLTGTIR